MKNKRGKKRKNWGVGRIPTVRALQAVCLCVGRAQWKGERSVWGKRCYEREEQTTARLTKHCGINIGAAPVESKSRPRWQVAFNGMGQQVPCVSSKGIANILYAQVNTLLESKVGSKEEGERERSGICYSIVKQYRFSTQGFNNEWPVMAIKSFG